LDAPDALEFPLLEESQQLRLNLRGDIANLVEENSAAMGQLDLSLLELVGPGKGTLLVPEEFALQEFLGEAHTIDSDERRLLPLTPVVDGSSKDLFPGAAFPEEQNSQESKVFLTRRSEKTYSPIRAIRERAESEAQGPA